MVFDHDGNMAECSLVGGAPNDRMNMEPVGIGVGDDEMDHIVWNGLLFWEQDLGLHKYLIGKGNKFRLFEFGVMLFL